MKAPSDMQFMVFDDSSEAISQSSHIGLPIACMGGHEVNSYVELLEKIAALNYHNSRFRLLFRGQVSDHRFNIKGERGGRSNLYPAILRAMPGTPRDELLDGRFKRLERAEKLVAHSEIPNIHLRVVRWAILQHYQICETPLLDVTLSLQSALSFAYDSGREPDGFLYVLAIPHMNGPVSISIESMTQAIDLCQICPPNALRPHFQSGVLLGDYPEYLDRHETHNGRGFVENDFSCRLLTKFHLRNIGHWALEGFAPTPLHLLFPDKWDHLYKELQPIKRRLCHAIPGEDAFGD